MRPARSADKGSTMARNTGGNGGHVRQSALWGSGNRGGELRSNALWGKGGRGLVTSVVAIALAMPLAASAGSKGFDGEAGAHAGERSRWSLNRVNLAGPDPKG